MFDQLKKITYTINLPKFFYPKNNFTPLLKSKRWKNKT